MSNHELARVLSTTADALQRLTHTIAYEQDQTYFGQHNPDWEKAAKGILIVAGEWRRRKENAADAGPPTI